MISDYDALLRKIMEAPFDDFPRYLLADWLEENGEWEKAVFLRKALSGVEIPNFCVGAFSSMKGNFSFSKGFVYGAACLTENFLSENELKDLFLSQPITEVVLRDCRPLEGPGLGMVAWCLQRASRANVSFSPFLGNNAVPDPIWEELKEYSFNNNKVKRYGEKKQAREDLSRACVRYGRETAGLPPLDWSSAPGGEK